jgi:aspartate aminotransferase-like enzyme
VSRQPTGWHFLQLPGPTNVPQRVLDTMSQQAALVNTLSPGDRVLMFETGQFGLGRADVTPRGRLEGGCRKDRP